jgi:hypothetical protein
MRNYIIIVAIIVLFMSCISSGTPYFVLVNHSDSTIIYQRNLSLHITADDTLIQCLNPPTRIKPNDSSIIECFNHHGWETELSKNDPYVQILILGQRALDYSFVFTSLGGTPCDTIRKYVPILHRYQLTLEDLQRMNWVVTYPPEE